MDKSQVGGFQNMGFLPYQLTNSGGLVHQQRFHSKHVAGSFMTWNFRWVLDGFGQLCSWATCFSLSSTALTIQGWLCCEMSLITSLVSPRKVDAYLYNHKVWQKKVKHATIQPSFHCHEVSIARQVVQTFAQSLNSYSNFGFNLFLLFVTHRRTSDVVFQAILLQGPRRFVGEL